MKKNNQKLYCTEVCAIVSNKDKKHHKIKKLYSNNGIEFTEKEASDFSIEELEYFNHYQVRSYNGNNPTRVDLCHSNKFKYLTEEEKLSITSVSHKIYFGDKLVLIFKDNEDKTVLEEVMELNKASLQGVVN